MRGAAVGTMRVQLVKTYVCSNCLEEKGEDQFKVFASSGLRAKACTQCAERLWRTRPMTRAAQPRFSGVDIDRIHYKLGAVRKPA